MIQQLIEKDIPSGIYNMADDEPLSTNQLIHLISESQKEKARIWKMPPIIIRLAARLEDMFHLPLNSGRLKKLTESYVVSNAKIKKALGIERMPVSTMGRESGRAKKRKGEGVKRSDRAKWRKGEKAMERKGDGAAG